jgi:hypothetical protein
MDFEADGVPSEVAEVMDTLDGGTELEEGCGTEVSFVDCERMGEVQSRSKRVQLQTCGPIVGIARAHLLVQYAGVVEDAARDFLENHELWFKYAAVQKYTTSARLPTHKRHHQQTHSSSYSSFSCHLSSVQISR